MSQNKREKMREPGGVAVGGPPDPQTRFTDYHPSV